MRYFCPRQNSCLCPRTGARLFEFQNQWFYYHEIVEILYYYRVERREAFYSERACLQTLEYQVQWLEDIISFQDYLNS